MKDIFGHDITLTKRDRQLAVVLVAALVIIILMAVFLLGGSPSQAGGSYASQCNSYIYPQQQISCFTQLALSTRNASICNALSLYEKDSCLLQIANTEQNISACSGINKIDPQYSQCVTGLAQGSSNASYCSYLPSVSASQCIYSSLSTSNFKNISTCNVMNNASDSASCKSLYYYKNAVSTNNASYCGNLQNTQNFTSLYTIANNYSSTSAKGTLGLAFLNISPRDYCYTQLAKIQQNSSLCGLTTTTYGNYLCTSSFISSNTTSLTINFNATNVTLACASSQDIYYQNFCTYSYLTNKAVISKNPSVCLQMNVSLGQFSCITQVALLTKNPSACDLITNLSIDSLCHNETVIYNANYTTH